LGLKSFRFLASGDRSGKGDWESGELEKLESVFVDVRVGVLGLMNETDGHASSCT